MSVHYDLQDYVGLAVRVMRVCHWQVGRVGRVGDCRGKGEDGWGIIGPCLFALVI